MSHIAVKGTQSPSKGCDLRRISSENADDVTPAIGTAAARCESQSHPSFDLLAGRYLHTTSANREHVSTTPVGNESPAKPNSKARLSTDQVDAGPEDSDRRSAWLAADLTVAEGTLAAVGHLATRRHNDDTPK